MPGTDPYNLCNGGFTCNGLTISVDNSVCGIGPSCGNITNCTAVPFGSNYYCDPNAGTTYGQCIKNLGFCDNNAFKCNDINQCTGDICNLPGQPLSYCTFPNNATGSEGLC